jgi:hypothetical protein
VVAEFDLPSDVGCYSCAMWHGADDVAKWQTAMRHSGGAHFATVLAVVGSTC